mgnify:CR=1 FL=1|tara:strand:+ start:358 stop:525 length:168 start_codon:yes stop_codon:yes gene_type:complete
MLIYNLLLPVVYGLTAIGIYDNVAKPVAKATLEAGVHVYEKGADIIDVVTAENTE